MMNEAAGRAGAERFLRALAGERVEPPVCGLTFVDTVLLPGAGASAGPASALASAARDLRLDFVFVSEREAWAVSAVDALRKVGVAPLWVVDGVLGPALEALSMDAGLRAAVRDPEALSQAMDAATTRALRAAYAGVEAGARGIVVADDMAGAGGPLLSPSWLECEAFPRMARIVEVARAAGVPALLHCDGDARSLFAMALECGFAAVHGDCGGAAGIEPSLTAARSAGMALVGGLSTGEMTGPTRGALAGAQAAALAREGGLLLSDDGGLTAPAQVEALLVAMESVARG